MGSEVRTNKGTRVDYGAEPRAVRKERAPAIERPKGAASHTEAVIQNAKAYKSRAEFGKEWAAARGRDSAAAGPKTPTPLKDASGRPEAIKPTRPLPSRGR